MKAVVSEIIPLPTVEIVQESEIPSLLRQIRPHWQAKELINRVKRLLQVDPSSACQRLLNASIHDLREKVLIAGLDIATDAAKQNGLPPISKETDIENYSTAKLIDLAYRMGLFSRAEWRRMSRCYEIRRDLEHEDDEYEAGIEDCIYIFKTCIEVILSKDPIRLIKVKDIKDLIEQSESLAPDNTLLEDYQRAPQPRQEEILKLLVSKALNKEESDIVQQNAFRFLSHLAPLTLNQVKIAIAQMIDEKVGRKHMDKRIARVAYASGSLPYLRVAARENFFDTIYAQMQKVGTYWGAYEYHGELLRSFQEVGGLQYCPEKYQILLLKWLVTTYLGEPGGTTRYGNIRHVYYSNTAAPLIADIIKTSKDVISENLIRLRNDKEISQQLKNQHIARRFESLLDLLED